MAEVLLYDSTICRLCAADNSDGILLYDENQWDSDLSGMINRYLPLKIRDDGKLPRTICPGCNIQLDATVQFFDLLIKGQNKIREMFKQQLELQKKADREKLRLEKRDSQILETENADAENTDDQAFEPHMIINILPDGSVYAADHEMSLQMEGLDKPRRKRGRPPKTEKSEIDEKENEMKENVPDSTSQEEDDKRDEDLEETDSDLRQRRRRKVPKRFSEAVQGKELERIFKEEGVIEEGEDDIDENEIIIDKNLEHVSASNHEEIIGHIETIEGKELGELVIINKNRGRGRPKVRRRKNRFTCNVCNRGFSQRSRYIMHKNCHKDEKYECAECKKLYNSRENLLLHQKTTGHSGEETKETANVEKENESKNQLNDSFRSDNIEANSEDKSAAEDSSELLNISANVETSQELNEDCEKNNSKTEKYPCDICGKVLNHPSSVIYHKEAEHNNGRRFVCNKCNKSFKHKQLLQRHQLVHSEDRPYSCKSCNASFKTKANLLNHQSTHTGEKKYLCEICNQQFAHKTSLTLHYRWHKGHKPYKCEVCSKTFSQNGNLQEHMRIHTGEKPYCCDYCGRKFTTSSQFKLHVKRHTGERPWKCEFCAKTFLHKDTWKCHVRRHKGEKPFQCNHCNRGFTEQWALKKHLRLHTGEKPYSCDICGKAFADCSNLTKHKKVHRENKIIEIEDTDENLVDRVWHILPENAEDEDNALAGQVAQVITSDDGSVNNASQIIYVSYQDPDDPLPATRTLQLVDASLLPDKETSESIQDDSVAIVNVSDRVKNVIDDDLYSNEEAMEFENSDFQLQITDEKGNPLSLTVEQTRQLLADKNIMSQLNEAHAIKIHSKVKETTSKSIIQSPSSDVNGDIISKELNVADDGTATISIVNSSEIEPQTSSNVLENTQSYEFTTPDGQKLRLFTSYPVDPIQLDSEYVTIM